MKLLRTTKSKMKMDKNSENVSQLEIPEIELVHFSIANNDYQHDLRVLNKSFCQLLDI